MGSKDFHAVLSAALISAKAKDYAGHNKFDALNSPFLKALSFNNPWLRLCWTQAVKQCPWNIRPWLGVPVTRNPKGIALFARAYLFRFEKNGDPADWQEAQDLLDWLIAHPAPGQKHVSWGYPYLWQDVPPFLQEKDEPNCVVTTFVGEALAHAVRLKPEPRYQEALHAVADFLTQDLPVRWERGEERAIGYTQRPEASIVLNSQALSGALLAKIAVLTGRPELTAIARRQMNFTYNRRTPYGAWYYTEPPDGSPIRHDNYHTGGILDALLEYSETTGEEQYLDGYWQGLEYYHQNLFETDGAPRWMNDRKFPHDVHGAAQGIITFAKASRHQPQWQFSAERIASWALQHLYRPATRDFRYRQGRWMAWDYSLMRWCNAWMARALSELLFTVKEGRS